MIWLIAIYIMCGLGVTLALAEDDDTMGRAMGVILFVVFWFAWPTALMFALTMALRAVATGQPNQRPVRFKVEAKPAGESE